MRPDIDVDSVEVADAVELTEERPGDDSVSGEQMRPDGKANTTGQWYGSAVTRIRAGAEALLLYQQNQTAAGLRNCPYISEDRRADQNEQQLWKCMDQK